MTKEIDKDLLDCFIAEASDALTQWETICLNLSADNASDSLNAIFRVAHNLKGSSRSIGLDDFGSFVHKVEDFIGELKSHPDRLSESVIRKLLNVQSFITDWLVALGNNPLYNPPTEQILKLLIDQDDSPNTQSTELKNTVKKQENVHKNTSSTETIRVRSQKLDQLIQIIGELGIQQAIVAHCVKNKDVLSSEFLKALNMVTKMAKEIQAQSIALRMIELQSLFQRLERTGRELAGDMNKKIEFHISGSDLELDKIVTETITEPLIHIIRNAIDHGIETEEIRKQSNKSETAQVTISARKDTDNVSIIIEDDGKGIDPKKVLQKAKEKGIVNQEAQLSDAECLQLIFEPGFSTAEKVTAVSGRGVGMDVVRQALNAVQGKIEIDSQIAKGSSFTIVIPTSMNIIDAVVVEISNEKYVIPLNNILEIVDLQSNEIDTSEHKETNVLKLRGKLMPLETLSNYLSIEQDRNYYSRSEQKPAIITGNNKYQVAFRVDKVLGQQRVIVKPLTGRAEYPHQVSGTTVLSDGRPGFIISLSSLAENISNHHRTGKDNASA